MKTIFSPVRQDGPLGGEWKEKGTRQWQVVGALVAITITLTALYFVFRSLALSNDGYSVIDRILGGVLLIAEIFILVHSTSFLLATVKAARHYRVVQNRFFTSEVSPSVALVVASFNEDPHILENTIISLAGQDYTNKTIYLLDDSTKEPLLLAARDIAGKYGCNYIHRVNRKGFKAGAINELLKTLKEKYIGVFDADQKPVFNFVREVIPLLEADDKVAFVQTPQYYEKSELSPVCSAAQQQQSIFYEYICEAKSLREAMFCCGTNVILRVEALRSIGGFDETSVTEDFATSLRLHMGKWKSIYYNSVCVYGMGPETLPAYFTQQARWAMGCLGVCKKILLLAPRKPKALKFIQWWEYLMSGSYYLVGWVNLTFILCPIAFLLFGVKPLIADQTTYLLAFIPYFIFSINTYFFTMKRRGYSIRRLFKGQALGFNTFWVHINSSIVAVLGLKRAFSVTPKGGGGKLPLKYLWPQMALIAFGIAAIIAGILKIILFGDLTGVINIFWVTYHTALLSSIFYFNREFAGYPEASVFQRYGA